MASYQRDGLGSSAAPPIVAIMGVTGSGKTSFISNAISRRLRTGDSLLSCTQEIQVFEYQSTSPPGHLILADTPGFDDTQKSDIEILEEFVAFIKGKPLAGIIYLHRINDNRMQGSAMKNLQLLAEVCGDDFLENLILVTTMWDLVNPSIGEARHNSLAEEFWRPLTERGAKLERYDSERAPARILRRFLNQRPSGRGMLEIQRESVCEGKQLGETRAGRTILDNMERERGRAEEFLNHLNQETNIAESHSEREQLQRERSKWREKRDRLSNLIERYTHRGGSHELQSDMGYYGQPSTLNAGFASNSLSIFAAERQYSNRTPMPRRSNVEPRESWGSRPRSADVSNSSRSFEPDRSFDHRPSIHDDRCPRSNSLVYTPSNERWNEPNERKAEEQPDPEYEKPPDEWRHYYR